MVGAGKSLEITFELQNGDHTTIDFFGTNGLRIYSVDHNTTTFEYQAIARHGSAVSGMNPINLTAITQIGFVTYGLHSDELISPIVKIKRVSIQFFVNGLRSLDCNAEINRQFTRTGSEEVWIWQDHVDLQHGVSSGQSKDSERLKYLFQLIKPKRFTEAVVKHIDDWLTWMKQNDLSNWSSLVITILFNAIFWPSVLLLWARWTVKMLQVLP